MRVLNRCRKQALPLFLTDRFLLFWLVVCLYSSISSANDQLSITEVASGIYLHQGVHEQMTMLNHGDIANSGFIIGSTGVAVIDPGERTPSLDGNLTGWLQVLQNMQEADYALVIPGHGNSGSWKSIVEPQIHYLNALKFGVSQQIKRGFTLSQTVENALHDYDAKGWHYLMRCTRLISQKPIRS